MCAQHLSNVLCVRQIQGGIHLVQDVDGSRFEQQHGQNERQGHQWSENTDRKGELNQKNINT